MRPVLETKSCREVLLLAQAAGSGPHMAVLPLRDRRVRRVRAAGQAAGMLPVRRLEARLRVARAVSAE